jgi:ubiquinone/menaquinone biosynthesis C-methylase UbiE
LAQRAERVIGLDLSPRMIDVAEMRSEQYANIQFEVADVTEREFVEEQFDCVASIAMLHHVDAGEMLPTMGRLLKANGTLVALDLYEPEGLKDFCRGIVAAPVGMVLRLIKTGRLRVPQAVHDAWAAHGRNDTYPTVSTIRRICEKMLPGAKVKHHLLWRYSIIWRKPSQSV